MGTKVWILESLRADDAKTGAVLRNSILSHDPTLHKQIAVEYRQPSNRAEFFASFNEVIASADKGHFTMLHLEAHGDEECLQLTDHSLVRWEDLSQPLIELNDKLRGFLVVTVAACCGAFLAKTALHSVRSPFLAVIGPPAIEYPYHLLVDYTAFYFEYDKTRSITKARWALNAFKKAEQPYMSTSAASLFCQAYEDGVSKTASPSEIEEKVERAIARSLRSDPSLDVESARDTFRKIFSDPRSLAREAWKIFMFIDKYPENAHVFEFPFESK
jgi:hypothetical protein